MRGGGGACAALLPVNHLNAADSRHAKFCHVMRLPCCIQGHLRVRVGERICVSLVRAFLFAHACIACTGSGGICVLQLRNRGACRGLTSTTRSRNKALPALF